MSHFTKVTTKIKNLVLLTQALKDLNYETVEGSEQVQVRGWHGALEKADLVVKASKTYDIGVKLNAETGSYEFVADWWGVETTRGVSQKDFVDQVMRRYAYHVVTSEVKARGYQIVEEENKTDQTVAITVRRWVGEEGA
jgi:hypothetical protein